MTIVVHGISTEDIYNRIYVCSTIQWFVKHIAPMINFQKARSFPPKHGEWFLSQDGSIVLGCIKCKSMYSVNIEHNIIHTIDITGRLIPSWTCINCGNHVVVQLNGYSEFAYFNQSSGFSRFV
jgi:hypothetical protein